MASSPHLFSTYCAGCCYSTNMVSSSQKMVSYESFTNLQAALDPAALLLVVVVVALANNNLLYHADGLILGLDTQILH